MKRAAVYARYSSELQTQSSIDAQLRACRAYCEKNGYAIVREYLDEAQSGRSDDRPAFQMMMQSLKAFDVVVCHKVDRFSRDRYDHSHYKRLLQKADVKLEYADQQIDDTPEGSLTESLLIGLSEYYSKNLARETMKGLNERAHKALFNGGIPPLGFDVKDGQYVINPKEAEAIRYIFDKYVEGWGYDRISSGLNQLGFTPKRGGRFGRNSLHDILKNEKYIGIYTFGRVRRTPDGRRNSHKDDSGSIKSVSIPAIIDNVTWAKVRDKMQENKKRTGSYSSKREYLLSGLLTCRCGHAMVGRWVAARNKSWYICGQNNRKTGTCDCKMIASDKAEEAVMSTIVKTLLDKGKRQALCDEINQESAEQHKKHNDQINYWEAELRGIKQKQSGLLDLAEDGLLTEDGKGRLRDLNTREMVLIEKISSATQSLALVHPAMVANYVSDTEQAINEKDPLKIRESLKRIIVSITWDGEYIDTTLRCAILHGAEGSTYAKIARRQVA